MTKSSNFPIFAYCQDSLPAASVQAQRDLAITHNLALEVANRGQIDLELYHHSNVSVSAVQAYQMHEFHPIHRDRERRSPALSHVLETLDLAAKLTAPRIVTVCGFGNEICDRPFERCLDFFGGCADRARALGIRIMIEPLSPRRCAVLTEPDAIAHLIQTLNQPDVFSLMLDTGHLLDSGFDLDAFFKNWTVPIEELQLKGPKSSPPSPNLPLPHWLKNVPSLPAVICVEHREAIDPVAFQQILTTLDHSRSQSVTPPALSIN